jgi:NAD(P)-dependent dehydrogenase (short-subunit alcohol dehydrogenase family)/acyl carrier protein
MVGNIVVQKKEEQKGGTSMNKDTNQKNNFSIAQYPEKIEEERLKTFQILQQNIFEAHKMFQKSLTESHMRFLQASEDAIKYMAGVRTDTKISYCENGQKYPTEPPEKNYSHEEIKNHEHIADREEKQENQEEIQSFNFRKILFETISEHTGYPEEMLDMSMDMETDLGIDSIKKIEILSALKSKIPDSEEMDTDKLAVVRSLQEILDYGREDLSKNLEEKKKRPLNEKSENNDIFRYIPVIIPAVAAGVAMESISLCCPLYIVPDNRGISGHLSELFKKIGIDVIVTDNVPTDALSIIYLKGLDTVREDSHNSHLEVNEKAFHYARICGKNLFNDRDKRGFFVTVQDTGGDFGFSGNKGISGSGLTGLIKISSREWENACVKAIDIECGSKNPREIAKAILDEIIYGGPELEAGLKENGERITIKTEQTGEAVKNFPLQNDDVLLVSGGARGVTAACLYELSISKKLRVAIFGRTEVTDEPDFLGNYRTEAELMKGLMENYNREGKKILPLEISREANKILSVREIKENIRKIERNGSDVEYFSIDIRNYEALKKAVCKIREKWGSIKGIIHGAGVLADKYIHEKTEEQFREVFCTKVTGFYNLLEATEEDRLTHICCFSSVSAIYGNKGQADYSMANEVLNKVCKKIYIQKKGKCLVKSINWGPWDGGMVTNSLKAHFKSKAISLIPLKEGAGLFVDEFSNIDTSVEVIISSAKRLNLEMSHGR